MIFPKLSPPNVLIGGPVPKSPGFPLKACRTVSSIATNNHCEAKLGGIDSKEINKGTGLLRQFFDRQLIVGVNADFSRRAHRFLGDDAGVQLGMLH
jgi:hypothetical protein